MLPSPVLCSLLSSVQFGVPLKVNTKRQSLHFAKTARLQSLSDRGVASDLQEKILIMENCFPMPLRWG